MRGSLAVVWFACLAASPSRSLAQTLLPPPPMPSTGAPAPQPGSPPQGAYPPPSSPYGTPAGTYPQATPGQAAPGPYTQPAPGAPAGAAPSTPTEQALREAEERDAGRGLEWAYFQAEGGIQYLALESLHAGNLLAGAASASGAGPMAGVAAGARILFFTVGARGRMAFLPNYRYATVGLEGGFHIPIGNLEPYLFVDAGYATLLGAPGPYGDLAVRGFAARLAAGFDYYLTPSASIGVIASLDLTDLARSAQSGPTPTDPAQRAAADAASTSGSGAGLGAGATGVFGLHFLNGA